MQTRLGDAQLGGDVGVAEVVEATHLHQALTINNKISQPRAPRVLRTREEIKAWLEDVYARDMTHVVKHRVLDETGAAYTQACRYPDGTNVLCATVIELEDGVIAGQSVLEVWDEG